MSVLAILHLKFEEPFFQKLKILNSERKRRDIYQVHVAYAYNGISKADPWNRVGSKLIQIQRKAQ